MSGRREASAAAAGGDDAAKRSNKRPREERDRLLAAARDETDAALEAALGFAPPEAATHKRGTSGRAAAASASSSSSAAAAAPAWHDEDDEAVRVDVAAVSRLRKLRRDPGEASLSGAQYGERLREQFAKGAAGGVPVPQWAQLPAQRKGRRRSGDSDSDEEGDDSDAAGSEEDDDDGAVFRRTGGLSQAAAGLPAGRLSITRVRDANRAEPSKAVLQAMGWHPSGAVLFTAGLDKKLRFFAVDGRRNPKVASVHFPDLPVTAAAWADGGSEVLLAGRRPYFYSYNVETGAATRVARLVGCEEKSLESMVVSPGGGPVPGGLAAFLGKDGVVVLASARTKQRVATLRMNGSVRAAAFARSAPGPDGGAAGEWDQLLTAGGHGEVYRWDLRTMTCADRHVDEGSTGVTALAAAGDGRRYAVGSKSGVVNVYDASGADAAGYYASGSSASNSADGTVRGLFASARAPTPVHRVMNVTTPVTALAYGGGGGSEVLAVGSEAVRDCLKLVHTGSGTVFANWPTTKTPLHYVSAVAFSPGGGYVTVGNDRGRALLYRLNHYDSV